MGVEKEINVSRVCCEGCDLLDLRDVEKENDYGIKTFERQSSSGGRKAT